MTEDRVDLLTRSWTFVVSWCRAHAPATSVRLQGPADDAKLTAAQAMTGLVWPEQLLAWLRLTDGVTLSWDAQLLPLGFAPLGVDEITGTWDSMRAIFASVFPAEQLATAESQPAGSEAAPFLPSSLPVASNMCGDFLFVDLRRGPATGCIGHFFEGEGSMGRPPPWRDLAHMLEDLAASLRSGRWSHPHQSDSDFVPVIENGVLHWRPAP